MSYVDNIPGYLLGDINQALRNAFPSKSKLQMMVQFQFSQNLDDIALGEDLTEIIYKLVQYFHQQKKLEKLISKSLNVNDGNSALKEVLNKFRITIDLFKILQSLENKSFEKIQRAYKACFSESFFDDWEDEVPDTVNELLQNIEDLPHPRYDEKLSQFVAYLLNNKNIPQTYVNQLKQWGNQYINDFEQLLVTQNNQNQVNQKAKSEIQPYLLVKLNLSQQSQKQYQNQYLVSSWFITDASNYNYLNSNDNCKYLKNFIVEEDSEKSLFTLEDIPKLLESFLSQQIKYLKEYHAKPIVIFFLPRKLLNEEIEKILPNQDDDDLPIPIGSEYCLMFRSVKRLDKKYRHKDNWLRKWKKYKDNSEGICSRNFICSNSETWQDLFSCLEEDNAFAVKLNQTPCDDIFKVIDRTAIPITLWLRKNEFESRESNTIQDDFNRLLDCKINELPHQVKQLRLQAFPKTGKHEHIGHHLTFLWEDPYLIPPQIDYTSPN